jgi:hypothetical protein
MAGQIKFTIKLKKNLNISDIIQSVDQVMDRITYTKNEIWGEDKTYCWNSDRTESFDGNSFYINIKGLNGGLYFTIQTNWEQYIPFFDKLIKEIAVEVDCISSQEVVTDIVNFDLLAAVKKTKRYIWLMKSQEEREILMQRAADEGVKVQDLF